MPFLTTFLPWMTVLERVASMARTNALARTRTMCVAAFDLQKLINSLGRDRAALGVRRRVDLAGPRHGEELVDHAVVHVAEPRDRPHQADVEHAVDDDRIIDMDADHLADHD